MRNVEPAIYNHRRLNETPIPPLNVNEDPVDEERDENWSLGFDSDSDIEADELKAIERSSVHATDSFNDNEEVDPLFSPHDVSSDVSPSTSTKHHTQLPNVSIEPNRIEDHTQTVTLLPTAGANVEQLATIAHHQVAQAIVIEPTTNANSNNTSNSVAHVDKMSMNVLSIDENHNNTPTAVTQMDEPTNATNGNNISNSIAQIGEANADVSIADSENENPNNIPTAVAQVDEPTNDTNEMSMNEPSIGENHNNTPTSVAQMNEQTKDSNGNDASNNIAQVEEANVDVPMANSEDAAEQSVEEKPDPLDLLGSMRTRYNNDSDIDKILQEPEEVLHSHDVTIYIGQKGMPKPKAMTMDSLMKRENDPMSGNIAFDERVNQVICLYYTI